MARTRRRSSYRKTKRWNPGSSQAALRKLAASCDDAVSLCVASRDRLGHELSLKRALRIMLEVKRGGKRSNPRGHRGHKRKNKRWNPHGKRAARRHAGPARRGVEGKSYWPDNVTSYAKRHRRRAERRNLKRFNPGVDRARPAYGQWLMKLGFPVNDPIVELGAAWASGDTVGARLVNQAVLSAERWRESRDRRLRSAATAIINKLAPLHKGIAAKEDRGQFRHSAGSLTSHGHRNPRGRSTKASRARSWQRQVKDSIPWWEKGRKNPFQESWHVQQEMRKARGAKGRGRTARRALRKLSKGRRAAVISGVLGRMNPKHRGGKSRRNPAQFPMPFVSAMNPGRGRRGRR